MMSSGGMPAFDEFAGLDAIADDWFTDTSFGNEVGGNGDDQHQHDFNSSMAGGSMALDVPMDDGGAGPMLQPLQTFHADASGQQQTLQQGYVQQMQPSTAQQYAAPDGSRQQSSEFQTLQPYDPGPQQQQQLVVQQQTQQAYYHQQQPSTSSAPTMTAEYVTMDSAYVNCQPTTSAAAPQTLQMNQPFDQQQILQSDQNVEYHQTAEGTWIAIHRAAPGQQPQQQQQVHSDAQQQQHGGNMAQLMPLSNQHQSMQQQPMQQQQRQPQQYQQAPQQQQQQYAAEHKFVEIDGTQQTIVYTQQPQQQRRSNDGQQILVTSMGQQRQVVQRQQIPQQQQQTHHQQPPTSYTVVQQNGQQVTYVDQRSMVALSGPHDQQQTQYVQSSQGSSGATYHAVQVLQPNGTVQTQMRLVQPQQSQQQAVDSKPPVQFQSLTGQPPPHPMTVKQPQPPPQPQPTTTATARPSRPPPKKKNNARVQQQPLQMPQHQPQQIIHVQQAPPQQPDSAAVGEVLGKVAQSGGFVMSAENSAELARLGMLQSQLQEEQQMRGVDNSMRLQQIERDMLALLTGAMPVAASLQQAMSQPAPPPPAPAPQPMYVQQQQPPPEEKPKPAAKAKRPRPSRAKPKAPVNNQPPVVTKAEIVEPQVTIAQPNVIYVDTNGNPIHLPPGAIIQTMAPNSTFGTDEYSIVHNTQPSTSYSIIDTSTAQSQPSVAKPATSKAAQARARKSALAAAQNAQHQPAQLVVYATQQPASNVPTTCTVTVRNDPIGQPPPRPLADVSRKVPKAPSPPKPKPIILPKPAELGKRIEEKRAAHSFRLGNYFEGLRNSLQQTDYKSEFRDLSDVVGRLLPFSLLAEPDLSEAVVEQFDYEYQRHSMHMSERMGKVESRLRNAFLKEAMEERDKDSELNMLLALDVEYERRQLDEDKKAASSDLESFVRGSELLRLPSVNQSAVKEAKANLREPKSFGKGPQHYEFHEFDPERYRSISPLPPSPPSVVEHTKSESESDYSSDEERSIQSPPKPWQRSAEKLAFGSPKETLVQPPMPQRLPTPSSLLPNETIVWEPEPIRPRSSAQERPMPATAPMSQKPLETPPPLAKAKSPEGMQPALSPQSMALQSQSHLPMKLRMKSLSMLKPLAQRRPEPPAVVEVAPPQPTIDDAVANMPSCIVVCEKLQLPPHDAAETPQQVQPSETVSETPPKPKVQPLERPIMTVRPMVKGRDEITRSMTASLQRIADRLPQPAGPQSDNKAYGIEESDSDEERANDEPKKPRVMLKINLKKPDGGKEQADNGEDEEAERKRRKKERKEEKKRKKKKEKSKKEERRRLRELQEHKDHGEALLNALKQPRISLKLSAKAGQPLHVEKPVSNNVQIPVAAAPSEQHHVEKIRIPRPVEAKPPAAAEEPPKQKLTLNFKKLLAARNTASSEDVAQQTLPPPPMVQQHHAQVPVAPPQLVAQDQLDDWPVADKKKKRGAKNSSDEDSDWEASRKGRNKKVKHGKQSGKPEKKTRQPKKGTAASLDDDAASPPKRPRLVMKLGRPPPAPEPVNVAPPLSSCATIDVPTVQPPPEPLKMKPLKIKIGGKVPKPPTESPKETKSPGLPAAQRPHATTPSTSSHRPGFSFFATSKVPASKANAKKSSQPSVGRSASSSSKRDVAQQPSSAVQQLPRQPSLSSSQLPSAPAPTPRQSATPAMHQSMPSTPLMPSVPTTPHTMPATPQSMPHTPHSVAPQQYANHPTPVARPPSVHEPVHPPPQPKDAFRSSSTARSFMEQSDPNFPSHGASGFDDTLFASRERIQFSPCSDEEVDQLHKQTSDVLKKLGIKR